ncbi:glutathione S-transferase N-terminal domain-containing protein [Thermomonas alba]|uniref:glutathione S-transferase N-terminal domain-containing protein n=1 Tax=Thermomonas alba TaxID=2888525 RepID=UPI001F03FB4C|nr:glutathione S-transferase N-terminal domain-containing protein [Thermomonas alba]
MIDLYYWPTPNGHKITLFLEEAGLDYRIVPVDIGKGAQFAPEFLAISPNNKMPAIIDHAPGDGGAPISVFESGAILRYLAEKTGRFDGVAAGAAAATARAHALARQANPNAGQPLSDEEKKILFGQGTR